MFLINVFFFKFCKNALIGEQCPQKKLSRESKTGKIIYNVSKYDFHLLYNVCSCSSIELETRYSLLLQNHKKLKKLSYPQ